MKRVGKSVERLTFSGRVGIIGVSERTIRLSAKSEFRGEIK